MRQGNIGKKELTIILHVILPLVLGSLIYIFLRAESTIAFEKIAENYKIYLLLASNPIYNYIINSFPDFCWCYSFLSLQFGIIWGGVKKIPLLLNWVIYFFPILTEVMQYLKLIGGTADWADVIAYLFAILLNIYIWQREKLRI
jgi:hypothetical protein